MITTFHGRVEGTPDVTTDALDIEAGVRQAFLFDYSSGNFKMLVAYCLTRHAVGEEELAQKTAVGMGIDLTSWYAILAAARAHAYRGRHQA